MNQGRYVHGEVSNADASAGVAVTLYGADGKVITVPTGFVLVITAVNIVNVAAGNVALTTSTDSAGKRILKGTMAANGRLWMAFEGGVRCEAATAPKLFAAVGQVDLQLQGVIVEV